MQIKNTQARCKIVQLLIEAELNSCLSICQILPHLFFSRPPYDSVKLPLNTKNGMNIQSFVRVTEMTAIFYQLKYVGVCLDFSDTMFRVSLSFRVI